MHNIESANSSFQFRVIKSAIVIIAAICVIIWKKYYAPTLEEETFKEARQMVFHGKIDSIYRDKANHDVKYVILSNSYKYGIEAVWEDSVDLGDSLSKMKDSLYVDVLRKTEKNLF